MLRRKVVRFFANWTSKWNEEIHNEIEKRVIEEFKRLYVRVHQPSRVSDN